jgi:tRNA threonylcarbamoyl adenosine modification protein YjeE
VILADAAATRRAGEVLASKVKSGDTIALIGDLGAGKTTLVTGLVEALGGTASSPTFSLVNEYRTRRFCIWHIDLYRIEREAELAELGLDDIIGNRVGFALIEWADKFDVLPADHLRIELVHDGDHRVLTLTGTGPRGQELASSLEAELLGSAP